MCLVGSSYTDMEPTRITSKYLKRIHSLDQQLDLGTEILSFQSDFVDSDFGHIELKSALVNN